jgi:hypothetical protein
VRTPYLRNESAVLISDVALGLPSVMRRVPDHVPVRCLDDGLIQRNAKATWEVDAVILHQVAVARMHAPRQVEKPVWVQRQIEVPEGCSS